MVIVKGGCVLLVNPVPVYYILLANGPRRTVVLVSLSFNFAPSSPQVKHRPARATSSREEFILHIESTDWMTWLFRLHAPLSHQSLCANPHVFHTGPATTTAESSDRDHKTLVDPLCAIAGWLLVELLTRRTPPAGTETRTAAGG